MALNQLKRENIHKTSDKLVSPYNVRTREANRCHNAVWQASPSEQGGILAANVIQELAVGFDVCWFQVNDLLDGLHGFVS